MKKILCIILAISTLASMLVFGVVAANGAETGKVDASYTPEGTAITSAAEFAAMTADGKYFLANDITIDVSYANAFTGTFDGNGKTVTASAPLFADLAGTVKNVTVNANIAASSTNNAIVAVTNSGDVTFENVHTTGAVLGGVKVASLLAYGIGGKNVSVKNCVNDADLTGSDHVAGFVANIDGVTTFTAENCTNNGSATSSGKYAAGIATIVGKDGLTAAQAQTLVCTIKNCTNNGSIKGYNKNCAGIIGYSLGVITIDNCVNRGNVENETENASGIIGSVAYQDSKSAATVTNCVNYGTLKGGMKVAGVSVYFGRKAPFSGMSYKIENCANYGDIYLNASGSAGDGCQAAGIVGRTFIAASQAEANVIKNCINAGNIYVDMTVGPQDTTSAAGIIAYFNHSNYVIENNINLGNITISNGSVRVAAATLIHRWYGKIDNNAPSAIKNNYSVNVDGLPLATSDVADHTYTDDNVKAITAAQAASGEAVYMLNTAAGTTVFYQDLANNGLPTLTANDAHIVNKTGDVYHNGTLSGDVTTTTTEAEVTTTVPTVDVTTTVPTVETTTVPTVETTAPTDETTVMVPTDFGTNIAPETPSDNTTNKPTETTAKPVDTDAPEKKGCGGFVLAAQLVAILGAAVTVVIVKKK